MTPLATSSPLTDTLLTIGAAVLIALVVVFIVAMCRSFRDEMRRMEEEHQDELRDWRDEGQNLPSKKK
jgi:uncharacterized membrane protein